MLLRDILKEQFLYEIDTEELLDEIEEMVDEKWDGYSIDRDDENLSLYITDDQDGIFEVTLNNAMEVKPVFEIRYSLAEDQEHENRKIFYLHQLEEMVNLMNHRNF